MTRKAYDKALVHRAKHLRDVYGKTYSAISRQIFVEHGVWIGISTVRDWVTYRTRGA